MACVQLASITGICFATFIQIPATMGSQFVMFLVLGIGLAGVFLMTDAFDNAPANLTLDERIQHMMCHAGPSIVPNPHPILTQSSSHPHLILT